MQKAALIEAAFCIRSISTRLRNQGPAAWECDGFALPTITLNYSGADEDALARRRRDSPGFGPTEYRENTGPANNVKFW